MLKSILLQIVVLLSITVKSQVNVLSFHVKKDVMRMKMPNGQWDAWKELGTMNEDMNQDVVINLEQRQLIWKSVFKSQSPRLTVYDISDVSEDSTYKEFGFWVLKIHAKDPKNQENEFKLSFANSDDTSIYTLIFGSEFAQSKCQLEIRK